MSFTIRAPSASAVPPSPLRGGYRSKPESRRRRARASTGITRRSSSASLGAWEPGRVDSPPTSTMSAPAAAMARPCAIASSSAAKSPPSEKLSGVTLRTPIRRGRSSASPQTGPRDALRRELSCAISSAAPGAFFSAQREKHGLLQSDPPARRRAPKEHVHQVEGERLTGDRVARPQVDAADARLRQRAFGVFSFRLSQRYRRHGGPAAVTSPVADGARDRAASCPCAGWRRAPCRAGPA